ncbi:MAG: DUF2190 family protein [Phycisphaeraceae bacterium]|nr:DUF2190 family protein [Phycisphaeraceae bacterium]
MATIYIHHGDAIDITPSADIQAGDVVVQGDLVCVSKRDIPANTLGAVATRGVFDFPKGSGAIDVGAVVHWDATNGVATTTASGNKRIGKAVLAAASADETVRALLIP